MLGQNVLAIPLAVFLNKKLKTKNLLRAVFFLPAVFSVLVIGFLWNFMYSPSDFGLINQLVVALGFERFNFLGDPHLALYSVIIVSVWLWGWRTFWQIVFALLTPVMATVAILNTLAVWNDFMTPLLFLQSRSKGVLLLEVFRNIGQFSTDWTNFFPMMLLAVAPLILFYIFMQKYIINGITSGSLN
ncbi:hypothetical protein [Bacillus sp. FJAT-28004]|uniref:hypothetical protein n=1 Tax=Bacillus sp. FJAT-28004 TaxID=1679165 RepID=UPI0006B475E3|nr:hypothetical protein [Bacillus sp. FJAT-28004]